MDVLELLESRVVQRQVVGPSALCAALDANDPPLEIDVVPAQGENVSTSKAGVDIQHDERLGSSTRTTSECGFSTLRQEYPRLLEEARKGPWYLEPILHWVHLRQALMDTPIEEGLCYRKVFV